MTLTLGPDDVLVLRTCRPSGESRNGFRWPLEVGAEVEAPDWEPTDKCGHGLHGLPWGEGTATYCSGPVWLVVQVHKPDGWRAGAGELEGKCKFRRGRIVYAGDRESAVRLIQEHAPAGTAINWAAQTAGNCSEQTAGDYSAQTAGDCSAQTAGHRATQTSGDRSAQMVGDCSLQSVGNKSTQKAGVGTVQVTRWYDGGWHVATRVVTAKEADKWYEVRQGVWVPRPDLDAKESDK